MAYIANIVFIDYHFTFLCYLYVSLRIYFFGNVGLVIIKIHNSRSHNINIIDIVTDMTQIISNSPITDRH